MALNTNASYCRIVSDDYIAMTFPGSARPFATYLLLLFSACSTPVAEPPVIRLQASGYTTSLGGDRFVTSVKTIEREGNVLCMNDTGAAHIICVVDDDSLQIVQIVGQQGQGPGEFETWPSLMDMRGGRLFAHQAGIQVFTLAGEYERTIQLPIQPFDGLAVNQSGHIFMSNRSFEATTPETQHPIVKVDSAGKVLNGFGTLMETSLSNAQNKIRNGRMLELVGQDYLLAVGVGLPIIQKYSLQGELMDSRDLSHMSFFGPRLKMADQMYARMPDRVMRARIIDDIEVYESFLYMLIIQGATAGKDVRKNTILVLDLDSLQVVGALELTNHEGRQAGWFNSFRHTSRGELLAFSYTDGAFYRYNDPFHSP